MGNTCEAKNPFTRTRQCKACPWKTSTNPHTDIPGGYNPAQHEALIACQSRGIGGQQHIMACHESPIGNEQACVGWLANQLGPGNNLGLRLLVRGKLKAPLALDGEQHPTVEAMVATAKRRKARRARKAVQP